MQPDFSVVVVDRASPCRGAAVNEPDGVRISVVVAAYAAWATLPRVLEALRVEVDRPDRELLLVESSGTLPNGALTRRWPWAHVITLPARTLPGRARNLALQHTRGRLVAFTDADAVPEAGWLDRLERAMRPGIDAVAGGVVNGTPDSAVGTSGYLLEFADWLPGRLGSAPHGATCNLLVRREALDGAGGFLADLWPGEDTVLTFRLGEQGRLAFAPDAVVRHLNRTRFSDYVRHQYRLGRSFSEVCTHVCFPGGRYTRLPFAPLLGPLRVPRLWHRLTRWGCPPRRRLLPLLLIGGCGWSAGLTAGALRRPASARGRPPLP